MGFWNIFRKPPPIRDAPELAVFIDENAAFLMQKGIFEYSRARAGHYAKVLFSEATFLTALEQSRWRAFPMGLAMIGELVEAALRPKPRDEQLLQRAALRALVLSVFDNYPVPAVLTPQSWRDLRVELDGRLQAIGAAPARRSFEIADPYAHAYFDLMPIHEKLRARDFPTMHNYLKLTLCNIHIELEKRMDRPAVIESLLAAQVEGAPSAA